MWANAQRDGRPAKCRWRPLFNAANFGWRPLPECRAVTLPRRETRWNQLGCRKLTKRSQPLVGRSSSYCKDIHNNNHFTTLCPVLPGWASNRRNTHPPTILITIQSLSASSIYYKDIWGRYCCLRSFFPIVDTCLSCEDIARQSCGMVPRRRFCVLYFQRAAFSTFQTCILNSH